MKKILFIFALISMLVLSSCGSSDKTSTQDTSDNTQTNQDTDADNTSDTEDTSSDTPADEDTQDEDVSVDEEDEDETPIVNENINGISYTTQELQDMIRNGKSLQCDYVFQDEGVKVNLQYYIHNGMIKYDSTSIILDEGVPMTMHAIYRDNAMYSWSDIDGTNIGTKLAWTPGDELSIFDVEDFEYDEFENQGVLLSLKCKEANLSDSMFTLPSDIDFMDYSALFEGMMDGIGDLEGMFEAFGE